MYDSRIVEPRFSRSDLLRDVADRLFYIDAAYKPDWLRIMRQLRNAEQEDLRSAYMQSGEPFGPTVEAREFWAEYGTQTTVN